MFGCLLFRTRRRVTFLLALLYLSLYLVGGLAKFVYSLADAACKFWNTLGPEKEKKNEGDDKKFRYSYTAKHKIYLAFLSL